MRAAGGDDEVAGDVAPAPSVGDADMSCHWQGELLPRGREQRRRMLTCGLSSGQGSG